MFAFNSKVKVLKKHGGGYFADDSLRTGKLEVDDKVELQRDGEWCAATITKCRSKRVHKRYDLRLQGGGPVTKIPRSMIRVPLKITFTPSESKRARDLALNRINGMADKTSEGGIKAAWKQLRAAASHPEMEAAVGLLMREIPAIPTHLSPFQRLRLIAGHVRRIHQRSGIGTGNFVERDLTRLLALGQAGRVGEHVYIIGAGPAGLIAAVKLTQLGVPVIVCERRPASSATTRDQILVCRDNAMECFQQSAIFDSSVVGKSSKNQDTLRCCDVQCGYMRLLVLLRVPFRFGVQFCAKGDRYTLTNHVASTTFNIPTSSKVILANGSYTDKRPDGLIPPSTGSGSTLQSQQVVRITFRAVPKIKSSRAYVPAFEFASGAQAPRGKKFLPSLRRKPAKNSSKKNPFRKFHRIQTALHLSIGELCYMLLIVSPETREPTVEEVARFVETFVRHGPERGQQCRNTASLELISMSKFPYSIPKRLASMWDPAGRAMAIGDRRFPGYWPHGTGIEKATMSAAVAACAIAEHFAHPRRVSAISRASDQLYDSIADEIELDRLSKISNQDRQWTGKKATGYSVQSVRAALLRHMQTA